MRIHKPTRPADREKEKTKQNTTNVSTKQNHTKMNSIFLHSPGLSHLPPHFKKKIMKFMHTCTHSNLQTKDKISKEILGVT